jgi:hypothetical protein
MTAPVPVKTASAWLAPAKASNMQPRQARFTARKRIVVAITISLAV